jgi:hypothetical protein
MSVCKRFHSIAPQVDEIFLPIPHKKAAAAKESDAEVHKGFLKNPVVRALAKPFHFISRMIKSKSRNDDDEYDLDFYSYYLHNQILKPFGEIRGLHLSLPSHGSQKQGSETGKAGKNPTTFLKWKAEFGRELHSCVILAAKSWTEKADDSQESDQESCAMPDAELKLRIVWTISCLIAASARHYLIQETLRGQKTIENVVVSDESDQGRLCMSKEQIEETRELRGKGEETLLEYRTRVPSSKMKMWYLERLEVPSSGKVMKGATLVVIKPEAAADGGGENVVEAFGFGEEGEGKLLGDAVRKLMVAKKCYTLEMNSF